MSDDLRFAVMPVLITIGAALGGAVIALAAHAVTLGRLKNAQGKPIYPVLRSSAPLVLGAFAAFIAASITVRGWSGWWPVAIVDRLPQFAGVALLGVIVAGFASWRGIPRPIGVPMGLLARLGASFAIVWWITVTARQFRWETGETVAWVSGLTIALASVWTIASAGVRQSRGPLTALSASLLAGGSAGAVFLGASPSTAHAMGVFGIGMLALAAVTLLLPGLGKSPGAIGFVTAVLLGVFGAAWQYSDLSGVALIVLACAPLGMWVSPVLGKMTKWKAWLRGLAQLIVIAGVLGGAAGAQWMITNAQSDGADEEYVW